MFQGVCRAGLAMIAWIAAGSSAVAQAPPQLWICGLATPQADYPYGVIEDGNGGVIVAGYTDGGLYGPSVGGEDAFVVRYDSAGTEVWARQLGTPNHETAWDVSRDGSDVFVAGYTTGAFGGPNAGETDAFLVLLNDTGSTVWTRQFGTTAWDECRGTAADGDGGAFVLGWTDGAFAGSSAGQDDVFIARYDSEGLQLWVRQYGSAGLDHAFAACSDGSDGAFAVGATTGNLGGPVIGGHDAWLMRCDGQGEVVWSRQMGTSGFDSLHDVVLSAQGDLFVAGQVEGNFGGTHAGGTDAFVAKYDTAGNQQWIRQFGTAAWDSVQGIALDGVGGVFVGGATTGSLGGPNAGQYDAFISRIDRGGYESWLGQFGTSALDASIDVAADGAGGVYIAGYSGGPLAGSYVGGVYDGYLARRGFACYPDCNSDGALTVADFGCFQTKFVLGDPYADCNASGTLTVADFGCFQTQFVTGCP